MATMADQEETWDQESASESKDLAIGQPVPDTSLAEDRLTEQARAYVRAAKAPATLRAYRSDWQHFSAWCLGRGAESLPAQPQTVALYMVVLAETHRPATITRRLTAICQGPTRPPTTPNPATTEHAVVSETLKGIRRTLGTAQPGKTPLADCRPGPSSGPPARQPLAGSRDRALLLTGYTGGLRRSELGSQHGRRPRSGSRRGAVLNAAGGRRPTRKGREGRWRSPGERTGPPARSPRSATGSRPRGLARGRSFARSIGMARSASGGCIGTRWGRSSSEAVARAGFDPKEFAGHSLRSGFATQAARNGASAFDIMRQTGHRSITTVSRYVRDAQIFRDASASRLGL